MNSNLNSQIGRFITVGIISTLVHFSIAIFLIDKQILIPPLANGFGFIGATLVSYFANTLWSFSQPIDKKNLLRFLCVTSIGFFFAMLISSITDYHGINGLINIIMVALFVPPVTFMLHNFWTYK